MAKTKSATPHEPSSSRPTKEPPPTRRLRVFAFDPSITTEMANYDVSEVVVRIPWERDRWSADGKTREKGLEKGPVGDYLEVVDVDPASERVYDPVDLEDPHLLATDGLAPSEGNPQFHQQMVYAVAMATIGHFERALGRQLFWSDMARRVDWPFYEVYGLFRVAVIAQQIYYRYHHRQTTNPAFRSFWIWVRYFHWRCRRVMARATS